MAKIKILLILFVITLVVMLSAFFAYVETQNLRLASIVKAKILFALQEISENMCNKDYEIAKKNLEVLMRDWNKFRDHQGIDNDDFTLLLTDITKNNNNQNAPRVEQNQ